jgi:hypothetical protein
LTCFFALFFMLFPPLPDIPLFFSDAWRANTMPNFCPLTWTQGNLVRPGSGFLKTSAMLGSCRIFVGQLRKEVLLRRILRPHRKFRIYGIFLYRLVRLYIFGTVVQPSPLILQRLP